MPKNLEMQNGESLGVDDDLLCWCMNSPPLHTEANVFQVIRAKKTLKIPVSIKHKSDKSDKTQK